MSLTKGYSFWVVEGKPKIKICGEGSTTKIQKNVWEGIDRKKKMWGGVQENFPFTPLRIPNEIVPRTVNLLCTCCMTFYYPRS